ncbi:hypothetical protein [Chondromyces apiculatus]|uniref:PEGA domain-containing protein n=1 Tax=Chondromyces apiculatus DSM 436 TaxID=1192034 RepID=A0A017TE94_9BACT|nr:hypothetical protein [Chondromyces apiculatus]EYF07140.1 Hypothetical protein CAP_0619 [Chondromyces apiculatus DSM 436]
MRLAPVLLALCSPGVARAQGAVEKAAAEALFREARALLEEGKTSEACAKFAESQRLEPKLGTLLNLASCHEEEGKMASAWAEFNQAAGLATTAKQEARADFARTRAAELETKLSRVVFQAAGGAAPEMTIRIGDKQLGAATLGSKIPLDPGPYQVEVTAPGKQRWATQIQVPAGPASLDVSIPALEDASSAAPDDGGLAAIFTPPTRRTMGLVAMGVGVVGVGLGTYLGVRTFVQKGTISEHCTGRYCDQEGLDASDDAHTSAGLSTVAFIAGGVFLAGGAVLYLTAKPAKDTSPPTKSAASARHRQGATLWVSPNVAPGHAALGLGGRW